MKTALKRFATAMGIILIGAMLTTSASAACGNQQGALHRQSWNGSNASGSLVMAHFGSDDPIVGMWKVTFIAKGNPGGPPDDTVIDAAIVQWHSDGPRS